jgi:AraC-like DNA-binding protein
MAKSVKSIAQTPQPPGLQIDPLSALLRRLRLSARVFLRAEFCGRWAVDSSGDRRAPFHLVTRGTGWLHEPGGRPARQLTAGDLVLFPNDRSHTVAHCEEEPDPGILNQAPPATLEGPVTGLMCGYFELDRRAGAPLLDGLPGTIVVDLNDAARHHRTATLIQLWMTEAADDAPGSAAAIDQLAYVVFIHILRQELAAGHVRGPLQALSHPQLGPVLNRIHDQPGADHSVEALAAEAGMSRSAFAQSFKERVGMTPARYVTHWRMQEARRLLESSDHSIARIAEQSGYSSEVAFRKAFRSFVGRPPGAFRRQAGRN